MRPALLVLALAFLGLSACGEERPSLEVWAIETCEAFRKFGADIDAINEAVRPGSVLPLTLRASALEDISNGAAVRLDEIGAAQGAEDLHETLVSVFRKTADKAGEVLERYNDGEEESRLLEEVEVALIASGARLDSAMSAAPPDVLAAIGAANCPF